MVALACPQCKSTRLKRSRTRNFLERLVKAFNRREYRCIDCGWRGTVHLKSRRGFEAKAYTPGQIVLVVVVIILAVLVLFYWLAREPDRPSEARQENSRWVLES